MGNLKLPGGGLGNATPDKVLKGETFSTEAGIKQTGTYIPPTAEDLTKDTTAEAADILQGKTAYSKGEKITGTMEDISPDLTEQAALIAEIRASLVGRVTEANATPEDILKGKKAYVGEKLIEGTLERGPAMGKVVLAENSDTITVQHGLKAAPKFVILFPETGQEYLNITTWLVVQSKDDPILTSSAGIYGWISGGGIETQILTTKYADITDEIIVFKSYTNASYMSGQKFYWIAIA